MEIKEQILLKKSALILSELIYTINRFDVTEFCPDLEGLVDEAYDTLNEIKELNK